MAVTLWLALAFLVVTGIMLDVWWFIGIAVVVLAVLPPRLDPAIRLKEWVRSRRDR